jgi:DNA-binding transcriptional ArsR family regulator
MVERPSARLDPVFQALADPTRRAMVRHLAARDRTVGELAAPFAMTLAAASKHIRVLERAGVVRRTIRGRTHICRLDPAPLRAAGDWLRYYERFWAERLGALDDLMTGRKK